MPYLAQRTGPNGEIIDESVPTPEEQAAIDAANAAVVTGAGGGNAPVPPPQAAPSTLYGGPAPESGSWNDPNIVTTYDPSQSSGMGIAPVAVTDVTTGQTTPTSYAQQEPVPAPASGDPNTSSGSAMYGAGGVDAYNGGYPVTGGTQSIGYVPDTRTSPEAIPPPTPYSWQPNSLLNDQPTERRAPAPLYPNALGGRGPLGPEYVNAKSVGGMGDLGSGARWAPPVPPPPAPATNWWDPITQAAGDVVPNLVRWITPGGDPSAANSARQAQDAVGNTFWDFDKASQAFGKTPLGQVTNEAIMGSFGPGAMGFGRIGMAPKGSAGAAGEAARAAGGLADDALREGGTWVVDEAGRVIGNLADDAMRAGGGMADDAARMRTTAADEAIPEPPIGKPLAEPEPVVDTAGSTQGASNAAPVSGTTTATGSKSGGFRLPRITKRQLAAGGIGAVVAGGVANNVIQTGRNAGNANQPPGATTGKSGGPSGPAPLEPGIYSGSTNPSTLPDWQNATTRSLELMKSYNPQEFAAGVKRSAVDIGGVSQKLIESKTAPGLYVGYIDTAGNVVPVGSDVSPDQFIQQVIANAAEAPAGWGDGGTAVATPDQGTSSSGTSGTTTNTGVTLQDVSIPAPDGSSSSGGSGSSGKKNSDWNNDYSGSSGGSYRSGKGSSGSSSDWNDREFTPEDFMDAADGDRKKAAQMARFANKRKRSKRKGSASSSTPAGFWDGFPFNRPPTPIREHVLTAIQESRANGSKR